MLYKQAFIPFTPFKIKDRAEYYGPEGERKRIANEALSMVSGTGAGMLAGGAIGFLAGMAIKAMTPGRFGLSTKVFANTGKYTGMNAFSRIAKNYAKTGKIPAEVHMPIGGMILGAASGILPAEYRARKRMERSVGIEPETTSREYVRSDVIPSIAGISAGIMAGESLQGLTNKSTLPIIGGLGVGIAAERIVNNIMTRDNQGINMEDTSERTRSI